MRSLLSVTLRLLLLVVIVWAVTGPVNRSPLPVGAAGLPPAVGQAGGGIAQAAIFFPETGYLVSTSPIGQYFAARGGARTFGPPVSNEFTLQGERVQLFRDFVLKQNAAGTVSTVDLHAMQAVPFRAVAGRTVPEPDPALVASAPNPSAPDYGAQVQAFITTNAPDSWDGNAVGFHRAFLGTVRFEDAFPEGAGERGLLPGFSHEVWGLPVSRPQRDPAQPNLVLLRWERGTMVWDRQTNAVTTLPLGQAFRAVLTGDGLTPEQAAAVAATGSPYLAQANGPLPSGLARPDALPDTALADAFRRSSAVEAGAVASQLNPTPTIEGWYSPAATATTTPFPYFTPTSTPYGYSGGYATPTNTPYGYVGGNMTPTPTPFGYVPPVQNQPGGLPGAIPQQPGAAVGSDPCYGDEEITFSPEIPRVGNEVLIAVTSSRPHPYGRLAGTEKTTFVRERPGQKGYVWEWTIQLSYPGQHEYTFYVDSTIPCKKLQITIRQGLATRTPTPTKTATPYNWNNNDNNNNDNNGNNNNNNDNSGSRAPSINPSSYVVAGQDLYNCNSFQSQAQAQSVLRYDPSDPNRLDAEDGYEDGIACTTHTYSSYPNDDDYTIVQRTYPTSTPTSTPARTPTATSAPTPAAFDPSFYLNKGDAFNCVDFASQANAQAVLRLGFQTGRGDENKLDVSSPTIPLNVPNGVACDSSTDAPEWGQWFYFPEPYDKTPVVRPTTTP